MSYGVEWSGRSAWGWESQDIKTKSPQEIFADRIKFLERGVKRFGKGSKENNEGWDLERDIVSAMYDQFKAGNLSIDPGKLEHIIYYLRQIPKDLKAKFAELIKSHPDKVSALFKDKVYWEVRNGEEKKKLLIENLIRECGGPAPETAPRQEPLPPPATQPAPPPATAPSITETEFQPNGDLQIMISNPPLGNIEAYIPILDNSGILVKDADIMAGPDEVRKGVITIPRNRLANLKQGEKYKIKVQFQDLNNHESTVGNVLEQEIIVPTSTAPVQPRQPLFVLQNRNVLSLSFAGKLLEISFDQHGQQTTDEQVAETTKKNLEDLARRIIPIDPNKFVIAGNDMIIYNVSEDTSIPILLYKTAHVEHEVAVTPQQKILEALKDFFTKRS